MIFTEKHGRSVCRRAQCPKEAQPVSLTTQVVNPIFEGKGEWSGFLVGG